MNSKLSFLIKKTWNNKELEHLPVQIHLERFDDNNLLIKIEAPFFDSSKPSQAPGEFFNLWDFEVVEAFFLSDSNRYIELEFGPYVKSSQITLIFSLIFFFLYKSYGHYIVILFDGERNSIKVIIYQLTDKTLSSEITSYFVFDLQILRFTAQI